MKQLFTLFSIFYAIVSIGQDTTYYDADWNQIEPRYYKVMQRSKTDNLWALERTYYMSGQLKSEANYSNYERRIMDGIFRGYYINGQIKEEIVYREGKINGKILTYYKNGKPKRIDRFENDSCVEGQCFESNGDKAIHFDYNIMPEFPGGQNELIKFLQTAVNYPEIARENSLEGRIVLEFVVSKFGNISNIKIVDREFTRVVSREPMRSKEKGNAEAMSSLENEAIRVVKKMPDWLPGRIDGEEVSVKYTLPFAFKLN